MSKETYCLNCEHDLSDSDKFCSNCGQKKKIYPLEFKEMVSQFFITLLNLDNTFFSSLKLIPTPWKLTRQYVAGKRAGFFHPIRMFIVLLFLSYPLISLVDKDTFTSDFDINNSLTAEDFRVKDSLQKILNLTNLNASEKNVFLKNYFGNKPVPSDTLVYLGEIFTISEGDISKLALKDVLFLSTEDLVEKYNVTSFWNKLFLLQSIKMYKNGTNFISILSNNLLWAIPIGIFIVAFVMYILYYRNEFYYLEHLILVLNIHSAIFIFFIISFVLKRLIPSFTDDNYFAFFTIICLLMAFFSMYKYYGQRLLKTMLKFFTVLFSYTIFLIFSAVLIIIVSAVLF